MQTAKRILRYSLPLLALIVLGAVFYSSSAIARQVVTWSPEKIDESVVRDEAKSHTISFTSSRNLTDVTLWVVPELEPYISLNPSQFSSIEKGETKEVIVTFSASAVAPFAIYDGTVHVRAGQKRKTYAKPLPVTLAVTVVPIPPDPGEAGKATLEGLDSDGDGTRDDIQRYIVLTYPESEKTRAALTQLVQSIEGTLAIGSSKSNSIEQSILVDRALECNHYLHPASYSDLSKAMEALVTNTEERLLAYLEYNEHLEGEVFSLTPYGQQKFSCEFDPDALEN